MSKLNSSERDLFRLPKQAAHSERGDEMSEHATPKEREAADDLRLAVKTLNAALYQAALANVRVDLDYHNVEEFGRQYPYRIYNVVIERREAI